MPTLLDLINADLQKAWNAVTHETQKDVVLVEAVASILWDDFKIILTGMLPSQYAILKNLVIRILPSVATGDIAAIEVLVLQAAEVEELGWIKNLASHVLTAAIALILAALNNQPLVPIQPPVQTNPNTAPVVPVTGGSTNPGTFLS